MSLTVHLISSCQCILSHFKADVFGSGCFSPTSNQRPPQYMNQADTCPEEQNVAGEGEADDSKAEG